MKSVALLADVTVGPRVRAGARRDVRPASRIGSSGAHKGRHEGQARSRNKSPRQPRVSPRWDVSGKQPTCRGVLSVRGYQGCPTGVRSAESNLHAAALPAFRKRFDDLIPDDQGHRALVRPRHRRCSPDFVITAAGFSRQTTRRPGNSISSSSASQESTRFHR